jgi:hypothetical protein
MTEGKDENTRSWIDEIEVAGEQLVEQVKKLAADAQVRRIKIYEPDGDIAVDIPLTVGAIAGGAVVIAAPVLAVVGALAAFVTKVKIEVVREEEQDAEAETSEDA